MRLKRLSVGYPMFSQLDPRYDHHATDILLFQLASTVNADIGWGDFGVGQFFIAKTDLKQRRFENAWLHWDGA